MDLEWWSEQAGAEVIDPAPSKEEALRLLATEEVIDCATLDVNLRGEKACPVADVLHERGIPLVLATGYEQCALPEAYKDVPCCDQPVICAFSPIPSLAETTLTAVRFAGTSGNGTSATYPEDSFPRRSGCS